MGEHTGGAPTRDELRLDLRATPRAAAEARTALCAFLDGTPYAERAGDAALALSELVTNAVLHGREPLGLRVTLGHARLRVAVSDSSPLTPSFSMLDTTAVTGRGLLLVANLADRWGLEPVVPGGGKAVWFELDRDAVPGTELGVDELLAAWGEDVDDPAEEVVKVVLTELDVALTARSEAHVEALLRELALVAGSADHDLAPTAGARPDPSLALVAERVVQAAYAVEALRSEMKHQLSCAVVEGRDRLDVVLRVTRVDADSVRAFSQAVDEADRLSRRGLLLTQPAPRALSEARERYLRRVVAQLSS